MSPDTKPGKKPEPKLVDVPGMQVDQSNIVNWIKRKPRKIVPKGTEEELVDGALVVITSDGTKVVNILPNEVLEESEARRVIPEGVERGLENAGERVRRKRRKKREKIESKIRRGS